MSLKFDATTDPTKDVDVMKCVAGCAAVYPTESYFAGVRWDGIGPRLTGLESLGYLCQGSGCSTAVEHMPRVQKPERSWV